ncbi:tyrosine-type recombinase/integrase [Bradyrhizobium sp. INPA01-394B]|uniref:Tyrosine-type recombinase/integrase n=1 Tax=Bradyrhizobium campsiandrae TaxID=1729892 RepID=A0ABR7UIC7_9BRAD|nr:tyrosine-type recombinase/integrase [Bradyrhizobium campsiandrae]MBC9882341.1 tyrosine-type recombinase/integrase [Bradyrhizobium campsiandrae]MBC9983234.1 tyrosine-type recombinase/integrase [Bradyrhizobium campsiandrae]
MSVPLRLQLKVEDPGNVLSPIMGLYTDYLARGRYCAERRRRYTASALHFGNWLRSEGAGPGDIDETRIGRFLTDHLTTCLCGHPVPRGLIVNRAALNNLLRVLRAHNIVAAPALDAIEMELLRFDAKMSDVWGLTQGTRDHRRRIIRRLLREQFGTGPIDLGAITPNAVRTFVLGDADRSTSTIRVMAGAVRCYLRYRALVGDDVAHLGKAVPRPAFWRDAELPEALSAADIERLFSAFDRPCPSRRRGYAIVRCLADLGLRSSEVIRLTLDDIDWKEGIVKVSAGKARRSDILPLSPATGEALVDYILHERPATARREVFVRHVAPLGEPVGRRVVQKTVHAAYARLGWDRSRVHILRHTLASRLVNSGASMKQIADVLRHRSIVTSATYARVDIARLSAVALPWPGAVA